MACQPLADDGDRHGISSGPEPFLTRSRPWRRNCRESTDNSTSHVGGHFAAPRVASATTPDRALAMKAGQLVRDIALHVQKESGR